MLTLLRMARLIILMVIAALISGCLTPGRHDYPGSVFLMVEGIGDTDTPLEDRPPALELISMQRTGDTKIIYPAQNGLDTVHVDPGEYTVKIACLRPASDKDSAAVVKTGTPVGEDQTLKFSMPYLGEGFGYGIDCAKSADGVVYVRLIDHMIAVFLD